MSTSTWIIGPSPSMSTETTLPVLDGTCVQRFATAQAGLDEQERLGETLTPDDAPILIAWQAPRALIVGRSDTRLPGFASAAEELAAQSWPVLVRRSGGSACPISPGTLQIALVRASAGKGSIETNYRALAGLIDEVLSGVGVPCELGERPGAFCPGRYDLGVGLRKFAGLSQYWRSRGRTVTFTTAASIIVEEDVGELCRVVNLFYERAGGEKRCSPAFLIDLKAAVPGEPCERSFNRITVVDDVHYFPSI